MIVKTPLFKSAFALLLLIAISHYLANSLYIYWTVWWFDMLMHFSAGVCVAISSVSVWGHYIDSNLSLKKIIIISILSSIGVGIIWEVFELTSYITFLSDGKAYFTDTFSDLIMDTSGGIIGSLLANKIINKNG